MHPLLESARTLAVRTVKRNLGYNYAPILKKWVRVIRAGASYHKKWTRDAAINVHFGGHLLCPKEGKNGLLASLEYDASGALFVGGQFWDAVIFALGAWRYYTDTEDLAFAKTAFTALKNTLAVLEKNEFDGGLFTGPAVYGDGISAYGDAYANTKDGSTCILDAHIALKRRVEGGTHGYTMKALSTNCVYYEAYRIAARFAVLFGESDCPFLKKAEALKHEINLQLYNKETGRYFYYIDENGVCDRQEALGLAYAVLFDVADAETAKRIIETAYRAPHGVPVVYPAFARYTQTPGDYGRHAGTVWGHAQAYFALAAKKCGLRKIFEEELFASAENAVRTGQFYEIFHPDTGERYGGLQEHRGVPALTMSCRHQTWSATGFLAMLAAYET